MTTPEAIRDLVRMLRTEKHERPLPAYTYEIKAAAALEQLLTAVEEAERVVEPFAEALEQDIAVTFGDLRAARDWKHKHGSAGR